MGRIAGPPAAVPGMCPGPNGKATVVKSEIQHPDDVIEASFSSDPDDVSVASIRIVGSRVDSLMRMSPVGFRWLDDPDGATRRLGFVAQQVEGVIPDQVFSMKVDAPVRRNDQLFRMVPVEDPVKGQAHAANQA